MTGSSPDRGAEKPPGCLWIARLSGSWASRRHGTICWGGVAVMAMFSPARSLGSLGTAQWGHQTRGQRAASLSWSLDAELQESCTDPFWIQAGRWNNCPSLLHPNGHVCTEAPGQTPRKQEEVRRSPEHGLGRQGKGVSPLSGATIIKV